MRRGPSLVEASGLYFPPSQGDAWEAADRVAERWDAAALEDLFAYAESAHSSGLLILEDGRILAERYWPQGGPHAAADCFSVQKSLVSLLVGFARSEGHIELEAPVERYLGRGWSRSPDTEPRITVRHLLTMTSGLSNSLEARAEPGSVWAYNTPAYQLLKTVVEKATGEPLDGYTRARIWGPIGAADSSWQQRPNMPFTGWAASVRDMARFGLLVLAGGRWDGRVVFPDAAYLAAALSSSQALNPAYGYLWWLNGTGAHKRVGGARTEGPLIPVAPSDMAMASGAGDKRIYIVPSLRLVVARHGAAAGADGGDVSTGFDNQVWTLLMRARKA